tara:strand:- start:81 stop:1151 length:1071 start_codon:yes stop_codon:yes gene_type:complete
MTPVQGLIGFGGGATGNLVRGSGGADGLYTFSSHKFTNGGATGRNGPDLNTLKNAYTNDYPSTPVSDRWWNNSSYLSLGNSVDGVQQWTVPSTGDYSFELQAPRAKYTGTSTQQIGAKTTFQMSLTQSDIIFIVCGQQGGLGSYNGGGAGGTFVFRYNIGIWDLLAAVGGAGGCGPNNAGYYQIRANGSTTTSGYAGTNSDHSTAGTAGGTSGNKGSESTYTYRASPGGGFLTTSAVNGNQTCSYTVTSGVGLKNSGSTILTGSFVGGYGSNDQGNDLNGGFGGGGGGSGACTSSGSGGGGGYSGGGVGNDCCNSWGGGGGSYVKSGLSHTAIQTYNYAPTGGAYSAESYVLVTKI